MFCADWHRYTALLYHYFGERPSTMRRNALLGPRAFKPFWTVPSATTTSGSSSPRIFRLFGVPSNSGKPYRNHHLCDRRALPLADVQKERHDRGEQLGRCHRATASRLELRTETVAADELQCGFHATENVDAPGCGRHINRVSPLRHSVERMSVDSYRNRRWLIPCVPFHQSLQGVITA